MGCHGEFQLGRESDCQDIVEIIKQIYNQSSFLDIKQIKLLFLLRKNRVYSRKYLCYCCYCYYYYYYYYNYYYGYFTANWTHARYQATPCSLGCLVPFVTINDSKSILQNFTPLLLDKDAFEGSLCSLLPGTFGGNQHL